MNEVKSKLNNVYRHRLEMKHLLSAVQFEKYDKLFNAWLAEIIAERLTANTADSQITCDKC